ncbi:MAG: alanine racemase [Clostridia bacterium]|nr:alanine racemase [Clostridia bacterium]
MLNQFIINKQNLINNIRQVRLNNPNSQICAMVKANAYGVGMTKVVKILRNYVDCFGVACLFEAKKVRRSTDTPILIVGPLERKKPDDRFIYTCHSLDDVMFLAKYDIKIKIHLKINSGMNRYGISTIDEFEKVLEIINKSKLELVGVFTHFATCDKNVDIQYKRFLKFVNYLHARGLNLIVHADNSEVNKSYNHHLDMVRVGFDIYYGESCGFKSVVEIKTKVVQINNAKKGEMVGYSNRCIVEKKTKVAILPIGYADGFDMAYIGKMIFVNGVACKVLNICMDCFMMDVTKVDIKKGDEIYILNRFNSIKSYADFINTIEYEVMTKFSSIRATRKVVNSYLLEA